jgi:hypothetical protein
MLLDGSTLDLGDVEAKIRSLLSSAVDVDSNVQRACEQFDCSGERAPPPRKVPVVSVLAAG